MTVNWPPPQGTYPSWPPPDFSGREFSDWTALARDLREEGWSHDAPTAAEVNAFFGVSVKCGDGHRVIGRMLVSPDGLRRYPFAVCNNADDREFLVLWPPFTCGWKSGPVGF